MAPKNASRARLVVCLRLFLHITSCCIATIAGFSLGKQALFIYDSLHDRDPRTSAFLALIGRTNRTRLGLLDPGLDGDRQTLLLSKKDQLQCTWDLALRYRFADDSRIQPQPLGDDHFDMPTANSRAGRHGILLKNNSMDNRRVLTTYSIINVLQQSQRMMLDGEWVRRRVGRPARKLRRIIAITPTHRRPSQTPLFLGLIGSLRAAEGRVLLIAVESGGKSEETAALLKQSGLGFVHLSVEDSLQGSWRDRMELEQRMRDEGMR